MMHCNWDPLTLAFSSPSLERAYSTHRVKHGFLTVDSYFAFVSIVTSIVGFVGSVFTGRYFNCCPTFGVLLNGIFTIVALSSETYRDWYWQNRTSLVAIWRAGRTAIAAAIFCNNLANYEVSDDGLLFRLLAFSGGCVFWCCGMPINFKDHVIHHSLAMVYVFFYLNGPLCGKDTKQWNVMFRMLSPLTINGSHYSVDQCRRMLLFVLFLFAFAIPTQILWTFERNSRLHFLQTKRISVYGDMHSVYMISFLLSSAALIWLLVLVNIQ